MPYTRSYKTSSRINHIDNNSCGGVIKEGSAPRATNFMMGVNRNHVFRGTPFVDDKSSPNYACNKEEPCDDYPDNPSVVTFKNIANYTDNAIIILDGPSDCNTCGVFGVDPVSKVEWNEPVSENIICSGLYDPNNWTYARGKEAPLDYRYGTKRITVQDKNSNKKTQFYFTMSDINYQPYIALGEVGSTSYDTFISKTSLWNKCIDDVVENTLSFTLNNKSYEIIWKPCNDGNPNIGLSKVTQHCVNSEGLPETITC